MIHETALDNGRAAQVGYRDTTSRTIHRWPARRLVVCIAALLAVAAVGHILLVSEASEKQPLIATGQAEHGPQAGPRVGETASTHERAESPAAAGEPERSGRAGVAAVPPADREASAGTGLEVAERADERPMAVSPAEQPIEAPGQGAETGGDGVAVAQAPAETIEPEPITRSADRANAPQPLADAPSSLSSAIETGSVERAGNADAVRIARVASDVRLRAGPSNGDVVLATVPGGRLVEVIGCRAWCEVIFAGQRGWVYKGFIGPSAAPGGHGAARDAPSAQRQSARPAS
jgi:hypothetical protein